MSDSTKSVVDLDAVRSLPKAERSAALRSLLKLEGRTSALARDIRASTDLRQINRDDESATLTEGWHDRVLDSVLQHERAQIQEQDEAKRVLEKLMSQPPARRETVIHNSPRLHTFSLCQLLHKESVRQLFRSPAEGLGLAQLAVEIAEGAAIAVPSDSLLSDLRGRSWTFLGNALRAVSRFTDADEAFAKAKRYLALGTGDPLEVAKLAESAGQLRMMQRRLPEATRLLNRAIKLYLAVGDRHLAGGVIVTKALVLSRQGDDDGAMRLLRQSLEMIDPARDPRLHLAARHNLTSSLVRQGHFHEAATHVQALRHGHHDLGDAVSLIRLRMTEGAIAAGLGDPDQAIRIYEEVRQQFVEHIMVMDVALVTLDLASVYLRLGRTQDTKRLAAEALPLFRSLGIHREAIAAFLVFQQAAEREAATLELVTEVAAYLRASRANPELKFRG